MGSNLKPEPIGIPPDLGSRRSWSPRIETLTAAGVAVALLGFISIAVISFRSFRRLEAGIDSRGRSSQAIAALERVLGDLVDAETGQRGYLVTGDTSFLRPYHAAEKQLPISTEAYRSLAADHPARASVMARLRPLIAAHLSVSKSTIELARAGRDAYAREIVASGAGKQAMDTIRFEVQAAQAAELAEWNRLSLTVQANVRRTRGLVVGIGVGSVFVLGLAAFGINHQSRGRAAAEQLTRQRVGELEVARAEIDRLNDDLREQLKALEVANHELETFSYSVSHDLRAPLRAIDGFSRMLIEDYGADLPSEAHGKIAVIRERTQHMGSLIDDLLRLSRITRKELAVEPVDMDRLVGSVIEEVVHGVDRPPDITTAPLPPATGDSALLRLVWVNLLSNAVKYSGKRAQPIVGVTGRRNGAEAVYSVSDNGVGFDMAYADKLFGVFQRLHRREEFEGTGIGLAIVHRVVVRHGGRIWAEATIDRGATFHFALPLKEAS